MDNIAFLLSRLQFAVTVSFHIIYPSFTIGLAAWLTPDGETFVMRPGDVLVAEDHIGKGHKWRLIDDQPWRRAYVVLKPGARDSLVPNRG